MYKIIKISIISLLSCLLLANCSKEATDPNTLVVATSADNPPYEFIDKGKLSGFDIDVINAIAGKMHKKIVIKNLDFPSLFAALASKNVDIVIAGLSVTPTRAVNVAFSDSYTTTTTAMLFRKNDLTSLNLENKIIGAQLGSTWEQVAKDLAVKHNAKVHSLSNNLILVEELKSKAIDAVILEEVQVSKFIENNPGLDSFILQDLSSEFAIALPLNSSLIEEVNTAIKALSADGTLSTLRKKWFP